LRDEDIKHGTGTTAVAIAMSHYRNTYIKPELILMLKEGR
jgi:hypothetical protein